MADFNITPPAEGRVTLDLTWDEAQVLTRVLGKANTGDLERHAPELMAFVSSMVEYIGRNVVGECGKYYAYVSGTQVYIDIQEG